MVQALFNQLLNQARTKAASAAPAVLRQTVGKIDDILVRPISRFSQDVLARPIVGSSKTFRPGAAADKLVREQAGRFTPTVMPPASSNAPRYAQGGTERFFQEFGNLVNPVRTPGAASLRPGPGTAGFPLDNPLTRLQATGQYLTRQGTGALQAVQNFGPTALNPLASRVPTTRLGQVGSLLNPLNPRNVAGIAIGFIPGLDEKNQAFLQGALLTPGGPTSKVLTGLFMHDIDNPLGPTDAQEAALIKQSQRGDLRPFGGDASIKNAEGKVWAGRNYGFQSPESFNALFNANLPTSPGGTPPPVPTLPPPPGAGSQAGQLTPPPAAPPAPGAMSNGAGVPAQRQNVQQRALSQEVLNAAQQYAAPTGIPLSSFYEGQQQLGRSMEQTGELQRQLKDLGGATGMSNEALMQWAQKNPALAYRELMRLRGRNQ